MNRKKYKPPMKYPGLQLLVVVLFIPLMVSAHTRADSIRGALEYQLKQYPASQYRDIYKNFMQDYFGPGHILNDTITAGKYLRYELDNSEKLDGPDFEPTGFEGNFYRVNLRLIKDSSIPYDTFLMLSSKAFRGLFHLMAKRGLGYGVKLTMKFNRWD